jgi:hypothetical protein
MFHRNFDGKATLSELERACETTQKLKRANLTVIEGRNAQLADGTTMNLNVAEFNPQSNPSQVHDDLKLVKKAEADKAFLDQMAAESRAQVGGDMNVFVENQAAVILVFGKTS